MAKKYCTFLNSWVSLLVKELRVHLNYTLIQIPKDYVHFDIVYLSLTEGFVHKNYI